MLRRRNCLESNHIAIVLLLVLNRSSVINAVFSELRSAISIPIAHGALVVNQARDDIGVRGTGSSLWEASVVLSTLLTLNPSIVAEKHVLELGAGLGLVSMTAAVLGAHKVYMTDGEPSVLERARENVQENSIRWPQLTSIQTHVHAWGDVVRRTLSQQVHQHPIDTILGADIIYGATDIERVYPALLSSLKRFSGPRTCVVIAFKPRHRRERTFWKLARKCGWNVKRLHIDDKVAPTYGVQIFELHLALHDGTHRSAVQSVGDATSQEDSTGSDESSTDSLVALNAVSVDDLVNPLGPAPRSPLNK